MARRMVSGYSHHCQKNWVAYSGQLSEGGTPLQNPHESFAYTTHQSHVAPLTQASLQRFHAL